MSPVDLAGPLRTTAEVATLLDRDPGTIKNHARKYKIGTILGKTRVYTEQDVARLREITERPTGPRRKENGPR